MKTKIMGVLNVTPDSFSDGGEYNSPEKALKRAIQIKKECAEIIDVGGESTRFFSFFDYKGSDLTNAQEELQRVLPAIRKIKQTLPHTTLSIDTWKSTVAAEALNAGVTIINSLGGFQFDEKLADVAKQYDCQIAIYHSKDKQKESNDICKEIYEFFEQQIAMGKKHGIKKEKFILDPGIGFGKSVEQNIEILKNLATFKTFDLPLLIGISRKSHLGTILENEIQIKTSATERLEASLAETAIAVQNGASIIRTHDIIQTKKFLAVLEKFL